MDYHTYTVEDFVLDPRFRKWVLAPDHDSLLFWETWGEQHPDKIPLLQEARTLLLSLPYEKHQLKPKEITDLWHAIDRQTDENELTDATLSKVIPLRTALPYQGKAASESKVWDYTKTGKIAACLLILVVFGFSYFLGSGEQQHMPSASTLVTKANPWGQRSTIYLSDGTEVNLNAGSRLTYEKNFSTKERFVTLEGEAFFKVAHDHPRPFRVLAAGVVTEALGTSFNVNAYDTSQVAVALVTGKVKVHRADREKKEKGVILLPGEGASFQAVKGFVTYQFDPTLVLSWKEGILLFKHADEETVFNTLERWYDVRFEKMNDTGKNWDYTGSFERKSLEHVLLSIAFAMHFDYEITQKTVKIKYKQ